MNGPTSYLSADELMQVAGGCNHCELNPPQFSDAFMAHPELYVDVGINDDLRLATM